MPIPGSQFLKLLTDSSLLPVYYFYGEEDFLIEEGIRRIIEKTIPASLREFNFNSYYAKETAPACIIDTARTLPVFSSKRIILVRGVDSYSSSHLEDFLPYIKNPALTTVLIFSGSKVDMRRQFYKVIDKAEGLVKFSLLGKRDLLRWIEKAVKDQGKKITMPAMELLIETVGREMRTLHSEIEKATTFVGKREVVDEKDIEVLSPYIRIVGIFEFIDALSKGDMSQSYITLTRLIEEGEPVPVIISMVARHFRILWIIKLMEKRGCSTVEVRRRLRIPEIFLKRYCQQSRSFTESILKDIYERIFRADREIKLGLMPPVEVLKNLTIELSAISAA